MARAGKERYLTAEEQRLIRYYVREGATEDRLPIAARRAKITLEKAQRMLKLIHVQEELELRRQLLRAEEARLDAQDLNRKEAEEDARERVTLQLIDEEMHKLIRMDPKDITGATKIKADILKFAYVVTGTIRAGKTERIAPTAETATANGPDIYQSIFERGRDEEEVEAAPIDEEEPAPPPPPMPKIPPTKQTEDEEPAISTPFRVPMKR